ncbi:hypothetical protein AAAD23_000677 [Escherichia coli]|uniref:hypothetical protein n=1 Tax=Escherichia coli TaxID=562 RepID=UPI000B7FE23C|nr:hypothetical protein [Escherichia coli]EFJ8418532.1 hypothetical protein [Escherichia coli]EJV7178394.1 hypothetical protein [Escherichia coli]
MKNTISKGFHRTGVLLAILVLMLSFGFFLLTGAGAGISLFAVLVSLVCALLTYGILRLVGWAVNGFIKDN